ncbi:hypothetical protein [uncultured Desulfovibrio sp.]|uniref:hypothetical protein n=1 Tax=uncultured Desulfovibrio sp. TaxID=167968 RepID=UPI00260D402E|nr:hypothetical protein [uncultured Desulfovibrio sp.]
MKKLTPLLLLFLLPLFSLPAPIASAELTDTRSLMGLVREPIPPQTEPESPIGSRWHEDSVNLYDDSHDVSNNFLRVDRSRPMAAYQSWLKYAVQGDVFCMAALPALIRQHPELQWPVPPEFWENWVIKLLGEGEGCYLLGAQTFSAESSEQVRQKSSEFFLRSALAGNHAGMMGVESMADDRTVSSSTPPVQPAVQPIPAEYYPEASEAVRYWLTRAADEGYWKACLILAVLYSLPEIAKPNYEKAKQYYMLAAQNGVQCAAQAIVSAKAGNKFQDKFEQVFRGSTAELDILYSKEFSEIISYKEMYTYYTLECMLGDFGKFADEANMISLTKQLGFPQDEATLVAGIEEGKRLYAAWRKRHAEEILQQVRLYAKARARLPEVQADYAAVAKNDAPLQFDRDDIDDDLKDLYADDGLFTPDFHWILNLYRCGQFREAYDGWLELALHGDLFAMATLPAVSRVHPELQWPVPPEFWENWLIDLLGVGEGGYILGAQYAMMTNYTEAGTLHAAQKAGEFFLRSALAGHPAGMLGAARTAPYRKEHPFTPPASPAVTPIPARFYADDPSGEGRYWLTRAANEGYWKACILMAQRYLSPQDKGKADYARAEQYLQRAARGGSYVAASRLSEGAFNGDDAHKTMCERLSTYAPLAFALKSNGYADAYHGSSTEQNVREKCPDARVREAGISESRRLYEEGRASYMQERREREELYAKARARLPEVRAAFGKRLTAGTPAERQ